MSAFTRAIQLDFAVERAFRRVWGDDSLNRLKFVIQEPCHLLPSEVQAIKEEWEMTERRFGSIGMSICLRDHSRP